MLQIKTSRLCISRLAATLFFMLSYFPILSFAGNYDSETDMGTLNGVVGVVGGINMGFTGDPNNKIVSVNVDAPPCLCKKLLFYEMCLAKW